MKSPFSLEERNLGVHFLDRAADFFRGYEIIAQNSQDPNLLPLKYQLLCQALELALKGWLALAGVTNIKKGVWP